MKTTAKDVIDKIFKEVPGAPLAETVDTLKSGLLVVLAILAGLIFIQSPGTTDVDIWRGWMNNALAHGLVGGFAANQADYPPLAGVILSGAYGAFQGLGVGQFEAIKLSILLFLLLTAFLFWMWTRNLKITLILYFALLLNSMALGYIDIYFAPGLVAALWMLKERRYLWFSVLFTLTCLTKWQPVIIAPFLALYILGIQDLRQWREIDIRRILLQVVIPAGAIIGLFLAVFGPQPIWEAFRASLSHKFLSGNALNLNWIITHFLHVLDPNQFGGLQNGMADYIMTDSARITLVPRLLFFATYLLALVVFFRREKTFENLVIFATTGFLCYYTFNTGVHENHLFLVAILAVILFWLNEAWRTPALVLILMDNINLFLFYGVDGSLHFDRLFFGVDIALPLAVFNVLFFVFVFGYSTIVCSQASTSRGTPGT